MRLYYNEFFLQTINLIQTFLNKIEAHYIRLDPSLIDEA